MKTWLKFCFLALAVSFNVRAYADDCPCQGVPHVALSADSTNVAPGGTVTLTWSSGLIIDPLKCIPANQALCYSALSISPQVGDLLPTLDIYGHSLGSTNLT